MAEGQRFKTGYLPGRTSYSALGAAIGDDIAKSVQALQQEREQKQQRLNQQLGFTDALKESAPAGLNGKYRDGAQKLLEAYQSAATKAYNTGNQADVAEYQRLKGEFVEFKNIAAAKSAMNNQTRNNIMTGNVKGMLGTREQNLAAFKEYDVAEYQMGDDNQLKVLVGGEYVDWKQSNITDMNDLFMPSIAWEGTEYMPEKIGASIYANNLKAKETGYQVTDRKGFSTGEVKVADIYNDIQEDLDARVDIRRGESTEAIAAVGYKVLNKPATDQLSEADLQAAEEMYTQDAIYESMPDGRRMTQGRFDEEGNYVFDISDEEIKQTFGGMSTVYTRGRNAFKAYYEESARTAFNLVPKVDQSGKRKQQDREESRQDERFERQLQAQLDKATPSTPIDLFPATMTLETTNTGEGESSTVTENVFKAKASVKGREFKFQMDLGADKGGESNVALENLVFDELGELVGIDILTGPGIAEGVVMDIGGGDLKREFYEKKTPQFVEAIASLRAIQAPSKNKRSGQQFLEDAMEQAELEAIVRQAGGGN